MNYHKLNMSRKNKKSTKIGPNDRFLRTIKPIRITAFTLCDYYYSRATKKMM